MTHCNIKDDDNILIVMPTDIEELSRLISPIASKYGVEKMYLFGSRARGDYSDNSDYDFSIDQGSLVRLRDYLDFIDELESVLNCKVNVVTRDDVGKSGFYHSMIASEILIYGDRKKPNRNPLRMCDYTTVA